MESKYFPQKEIKCGGKRKGNIPLDTKTRKLIRRKDLWTRYMETRGQKYLEYCKARNKVKSVVKAKRRV